MAIYWKFDFSAIKILILLYGSYDERTFCMLVMMSRPIVCQL